MSFKFNFDILLFEIGLYTLGAADAALPLELLFICDKFMAASTAGREKSTSPIEVLVKSGESCRLRRLLVRLLVNLANFACYFLKKS